MGNHSIIMYIRNILIGLGLAATLISCNDTQNQNYKAAKMNSDKVSVSETTRQSIKKIKDHRILFAHHSVGENILDGLQMIAKESGFDLQVENIEAVPLTEESKFVDVEPGKNQYPKTKIDGFSQKIRSLNKSYVPDVAFMKFCYVDFRPDTDVNEIFEYYKNNIEALRNEMPEITFAHLTVPLTTNPENLKSRVKRLLGIEVWADASNIKRARFNELLMNEFPNDPIFDIARIESTRIDGSRVEFNYDGKTYYSLAPEYTDDGGHLNSLGRRVVASEMAEFLAKTLKSDNIIQ